MRYSPSGTPVEVDRLHDEGLRVGVVVALLLNSSSRSPNFLITWSTGMSGGFVEILESESEDVSLFFASGVCEAVLETSSSRQSGLCGQRRNQHGPSQSYGVQREFAAVSNAQCAHRCGWGRNHFRNLIRHGARSPRSYGPQCLDLRHGCWVAHVAYLLRSSNARTFNYRASGETDQVGNENR